jgi:hypothetical protein
MIRVTIEMFLNAVLLHTTLVIKIEDTGGLEVVREIIYSKHFGTCFW